MATRRQGLKRVFAKGMDGYVSREPMHFTLRKMQALLTEPRFWGAVLTVSVVLGVAGPFGTFAYLGLLPRFAYWFAISLLTFLAGYATVVPTLRLLPDRPGWRPLRIIVAGFVAAVPVTAIIVAFNAALFVETDAATGDVLRLYVNCGLIAAAVTFLSTLIGEREAPEQPAPEVPAAAAPPAQATIATTPRPKLLDRLPPQLRGRLVRLAMQDHYVEVFTDKGSTLVLMRLADAIEETAPVEGLQVHRSHWVAADAVAGTKREDGKLHVKLADGALLPVSRSHLGAVRSRGWT